MSVMNRMLMGFGLSIAMGSAMAANPRLVSNPNPNPNTGQSSQSGVSKINARRVHFQDNQQVILGLSRTGINRLFVSGDKIQSIAAPEAYLNARHDQSGSIYVSVLALHSFTAFVNTQAGHHFSILVRPKAIPSQTIDFLAESPTQKTIAWAKNSAYEQRMIDVMRALLKGKRPRGMAEKSISQAKPITLGSIGTLTLMQSYQGTLIGAAVLRLENHTDHTISLSPNQFYRPGVLAVSLQNQSIGKERSSEVFEVVSIQDKEDNNGANK